MYSQLRAMPASAKAALVFAVLGFLVNLDYKSSTSINGGVVACHYMNFWALGFGAPALLAGGSTWWDRFTEDPLTERIENRGLVLVVGAVGILVGVIHVLRGMGIVGGPC